MLYAQPSCTMKRWISPDFLRHTGEFGRFRLRSSRGYCSDDRESPGYFGLIGFHPLLVPGVVFPDSYPGISVLLQVGGEYHGPDDGAHLRVQQVFLLQAEGFAPETVVHLEEADIHVASLNLPEHP